MRRVTRPKAVILSVQDEDDIGAALAALRELIIQRFEDFRGRRILVVAHDIAERTQRGACCFDKPMTEWCVLCELTAKSSMVVPETELTK